MVRLRHVIIAALIGAALLCLADGAKAKKKSKDRSTSSSSKEAKEDRGSVSEGDDGQSLNLSSDKSPSISVDENTKQNKKKPSKSKSKKHMPLSSEERKGWRKWHRKCTPCPEDMNKKYRDPTITWVCGGYQRARRSFKSVCMMRYRNCQDGTMFVKIHNYRCKNYTRGVGKEPRPYGVHFFYDYKAKLSQDSESSKTAESSDASTSFEWRRAMKPQQTGQNATLTTNTTAH